MKNYYSLALAGTLIVCIFTFSILQHFVFGQERTLTEDYKLTPTYDISYEVASVDVPLPSPPAPVFFEAELPLPPPPEPVPSYIYIVTSVDGYIVVQYANSKTGDGVHLTTNKAVNALPLEEQERLETGIPVYTEDALFRLLEDYGS